MNISNEQKKSIDRWTAIGHPDKNNFIFFVDIYIVKKME